jgi:hypothetical protein
MKISNIMRLIGLVAIHSCTTLALAEPHLCPSGKGIKAAIQNKNLVQFVYADRYVGDAKLEYFGSFDTNETWFFSIMVMELRNATQAWKRFQFFFDEIPVTPQYAENFLFTWECHYSIGIDGYGWPFHAHATLKSP